MGVSNSNAKRKYENAMPSTDEGWWESVLAEERRHAPVRPPQPVAAKPNPVAPQAKAEVRPLTEVVEADWDQVRELYANDRIVAMKVTGHNRGGLLVEADSFSGFVPFSHLIELAGKEQETDRDASLESYMGRTLSVKAINVSRRSMAICVSVVS